jgi:segregation and condensation protein B
MSNEQSIPEEVATPRAEDAVSPSVTALVSTQVEADQDSGTVAELSPPTIDVAEAKLALEAVLMAASEPMAVNELKRIFDGELSGDTVRNLLEEMRTDWKDRSVELSLVASGYRFRVRPVFQKYLDRLSSEKPPRYSRAVLETLAIIAYRQPVTRGDIEDIRGVQVSPHILKTLQDRGWIDEIGHKEVVGRPTLFATTRHFLDDLNLRSLEELPPLHELQATLDMTQAGAVLIAGETPSLPGVGSAAANEVAASSADFADGDFPEQAPAETGATRDALPAVEAEPPPAGTELPTESGAPQEITP